MAAGEIIVGGLDDTRSIRAFATDVIYTNIRARLGNPVNFGPVGIVPEPVTLVASVPEITPAALNGIDLFIVTEVTSLSPTEAELLRDFVLDGNGLILVTDAESPGRVGANAMLQLLDGGAVTDPASLNTAKDTGHFIASAASTNGPFGDLNDGRFATSEGSTVSPGTQSIVVGNTDEDTFNLIVEIPADALAPGSGGVLAMGDVLFSNFFVPPDAIVDNENNANFVMNFIASFTTVPEPLGLTTWGLGVAGLTCLTRPRRRD